MISRLLPVRIGDSFQPDDSVTKYHKFILLIYILKFDSYILNCNG